MAESNTLAKALEDVRQRRVELQAEHERLTAELSKLRLAERSLAAIVEGAPLADDFASAGDEDAVPKPRQGRRGARGPRANSAKGRLRSILLGAGSQGLSQAEIARKLPDVAPATLNAYLSTMSTSGEVIRAGDFFRMEPDGEAEGDEGAEDGAPDEDQE
ncbi:hypothetical protein [Methylobacterium aerolatum]|uniref:HTH iclR-type domain-containing protein n=1 Tax=Methylobacterium aerolatum TaxID=418708 RepID=A0ABU0I5Q1_9HYPH|nr:hypothetical protein [Methylobacterium aerolatum]MDQ0449946.1 hypothetical protein [Methylobacterium aerolatum]GJD37493.1 hypothetical protein FMGBMHLM_4425 [Methylobacterium aerolatum]